MKHEDDYDWQMKRRVRNGRNGYQKLHVDEFILNDGDWLRTSDLFAECVLKRSLEPIYSLSLIVPEFHFSTTAHRILNNDDIFQGGIAYCIFKGTALEYVGQTFGFRTRIQEHKYTLEFDIMDEDVIIQGYFIPSEEDLDIYELFLINTLKPILNKKLVYSY